jgi:hypothetical protein
MKYSTAFVGLSIVFQCIGCGPRLNLANAIEPESVATGWADAGTVAGKNKIVPAITFRLKNVSDQKLAAVLVNAVFRRNGDPGEWSSSYLPNVAKEMPPGLQTDSRTAAGQQGYTGTDDREELLRNSKFVDAKAELFVRAGGSNWTRIGEYPIARQLLPVMRPSN